jgi:hypothetical protein
MEVVAIVHLREAVARRRAPSEPERAIVREYGRDSLLVWANLLLAPLFAALGLRVGLQSEERLAARIEADTAELRKRGYLVASVQTFTLPGLAGRRTDAHWYRVSFERAERVERLPQD